MSGRKPMHILRTGTFTASSGARVSLSQRDLRGIADSYDPDVHRSPVVVGHPKSNRPAYAWIASLECRDGGLYATPEDVEPKFAEMVRRRRFRKISASLYMPSADDHPLDSAASPYLRHVGFLGAQPPAVKGLEEYQFDDGGDAVVIEIELAEPDPSLPTTLAEPGGSDVSGETPEEREANLSEREKQIETREKKFERRQRKARLRAHREFAEGLERDGRILPRHTDTIVGLLGALPEDTEVEFAENADDDAEDIPAVDAFRKFLEDLPKRVHFEEVAGANKDARARSGGPRLPVDTPMRQERVELHERVRKYASEHNITYEAALSRVASADD